MGLDDENEKKAQKIVEKIVDAITSKFGGDRKFEIVSFGLWQSRLKEHVIMRLKGGMDWDKAEKNVLHVAKEMGRIAEALSDEDDVIAADQLEAAFQAARKHKRCPPVFDTSGQKKLGSWCDF